MLSPSLSSELESLALKARDLEHENETLKEMNARLSGSILAKDVEISALKKELEEWKKNYQ